jgi:hypothetical protein
MYDVRLIKLPASDKRVSVALSTIPVLQICCLLKRIDESCRSLAGLAAANRATAGLPFARPLAAPRPLGQRNINRRELIAAVTIFIVGSPSQVATP